MLHVTSFCCANNHLPLSEVAPRSPVCLTQAAMAVNGDDFLCFLFSLYKTFVYIIFKNIIYIYMSVILHCIFDYSCYLFLSCISSVILHCIFYLLFHLLSCISSVILHFICYLAFHLVSCISYVSLRAQF